MVAPPLNGPSNDTSEEIYRSPPPAPPLEGGPQPAGQASPGSYDRMRELQAEFYDRLRELRAEVQDLQRALTSVRKGEANIKSFANYIKKTRKDIESVMGQIRAADTRIRTGIESPMGEVRAAGTRTRTGIRNPIRQIPAADTVRGLYDTWEQMVNSPILQNPEAGRLPAEEQLRALSLLDEQIRRLVFAVGTLTIPPRVNEWLLQAWPGYYIPFHAVFEDEIPIPEDRVKMLNLLAWAPKIIHGGIVNTVNGVIYRYNESPWKRLLNYVLLVLALALSPALLYGLCQVQAAGWPFQGQHFPSLLFGWLALLAGVIVHVAVGTVKRVREQGGLPPIIAIGVLPRIIDAKAGEILLKLLLVLIGLLGLALAGGLGGVTPVNAFLVGYSLDSVVEIFGTSIEQRSAAQAAALKQRMGITSEK